MPEIMKTIAIIEDIQEVAENLHTVISSSSGFRCLSRHSSAEEALCFIDKHPADIYLVDLGLPGADGVTFIEKAKSMTPASDFVVYTVFEGADKLMAALAAGAAGYILKDWRPQEVIDSLTIVAKGGGILHPRMARRLFSYFSEISPPNQPLTPTEMDVLKKLKTGMTYDKIAEMNHVSRSTIETHIKHIYKKLNVKNRNDAVRTGILYGIIENERPDLRDIGL